MPREAPTAGMKVVEVRIDAAAEKFQLRHLPDSPAIGIGIAFAIDPLGTRSSLHDTDDIVATSVADHQQLTASHPSLAVRPA